MAKLSAISAVTANPHFYMQTHKTRGIDSIKVIKFLKHLGRHIKNKIFIIWDNGPIHRSKIVNQFLKDNRKKYRAFRIPGYAPELNADEGPWSHLKWHELKGYAASNIDELAKRLQKGGAKIRKNKKLIKSFLDRTPLNFDNLSINLCKDH
jgi:transposase